MPDYESRVADAVEAEARGVDVIVNEIALPGSAPNETVSTHVARLAAAGNRWGCIACKFLDWAVEKNHCANTLSATSGHSPVSVYIRAGLWFAAGFFLIGLGIYCAF
jgi:hypothetical protein